MARSRAGEPSGHLWLEEGAQRRALVAEVAPVIPVHHSYSFVVPDALGEALQLGQRVRVPLGKRGRLVEGFVLGIDRRAWDSTLRPIDSLIDAESYLTPELIDLGREIAKHYACPLGQTLRAVTPQAVRNQAGLVTVRYAALSRPLADLDAEPRRVSAKRRAVLEVLAREPNPIPVADLLAQVGASTSLLRTLAKEGWVEVSARKEIRTGIDFDRPAVEPDYELNEAQRHVLGAINKRVDAGDFSVTLLFGVSGCGKTEVYIQAIRRVVARGRQAILLVPEIVLTTQLVQRLAERFTQVAVSHSGLTDAQRSVIWRQVASGEKKVIIGTRSAVFAPCPDLGLICVDEEQESSYKNLQAPRFHVRDVAILRAHQGGFPVVLGSATPALETWYNADTRAYYERVTIPERVKALPLPKVHVVDMREEPPVAGQVPVLSRLLEVLLTETLKRNEQAVILMNRRGYASRLICPACGARIECPHCNVGLVVHAARGSALCHYCRTRIPIPTTCPTLGCGGRLVRVGFGTQRVEDVLTKRFPTARLRRVDSDTMRHRDQYQQVIDDFEARRIDVLVGTQMIAKGLDFPFVSLVGVINADPVALASDFRAQERLFQLVTQVAGRAGRAGTAGEVVVQTTWSESHALSAAVHHDYEAFARRELQVRRRNGFPPFRRLTRLVLAHEREEYVIQQSEELATRIRTAVDRLSLPGSDVLGPTPCPLVRLRGRYRYDLLVLTPDATAMRRLLSELRTQGALKPKTVSLTIDVDPVTLT